jgi:hypothetical protein
MAQVEIPPRRKKCGRNRKGGPPAKEGEEAQRRLQHHVPEGQGHDAGGNLSPVLGVGDEERPVAEDVDQPWGPPGVMIEPAQRPAGKGGPLASPGKGNAVGDICRRVFPVQGVEMVAERYTLVDLAQLGPFQQASQLRLAGEDDLDQLVRVRFKVGDEADLFQEFRGEVLRRK